MRTNKKTRKNVAVSRRRGGRIFASVKYFGFVVLPVIAVVATLSLVSGVLKSACRVKTVVITGN